MQNIIKIETGAQDVHPLAATVQGNLTLEKDHEFTMLSVEQVESISLVLREDNPSLIDGIGRLQIALKHPDKFPILNCNEYEISNAELT